MFINQDSLDSIIQQATSLQDKIKKQAKIIADMKNAKYIEVRIDNFTGVTFDFAGNKPINFYSTSQAFVLAQPKEISLFALALTQSISLAETGENRMREELFELLNPKPLVAGEPSEIGDLFNEHA